MNGMQTSISDRQQSNATLKRQVGYGYILIACLATLTVVPPGILAFALAGLVMLELLAALDSSPPVREITGAIAVLQNVFGPWLLYTFFNEHHRYRMYIDEGTYFAFAIPATCMLLLGLGLRIPFGTAEMRLPRASSDTYRVGMILVVIGLAAGVVARFGPASLAFLFYLLANLRYIGAIYVYTSGHVSRWAVVFVVTAGIVLTSSRYGMFHELLLWSSLGGSYFFLGKNRPFAVKAGALGLVVAAIVVIQIVKPIYRKRLEFDARTSFAATARDVVQTDSFLSKKSMEGVVTRVSQGWIVSAAMYTVPSQVAHAHGETIKDAAVAALVPRVIMPNKKRSISTANVNKYTFLRVGRTTSMGLGPLGESWVNYGRIGGIMVMFAFGILINCVFRLACKFSRYDDFFFFCVPLIFLQVVKAETEFLTVFNHIVKATVIVFLVYQALNAFGLLKTNTSEDTNQIGAST